MRLILASTVILLGLSVLTGAAAQQPPAPPPAQAPASPTVPLRADQTFPAQQRPLADPAVIERGKTIYGINCRLCHGPDLRGGDMGGVNLLRSALVLSENSRELSATVTGERRLATESVVRAAAVPLETIVLP